MEAFEDRTVPSSVVTIEALDDVGEDPFAGAFRLIRTGDLTGDLSVNLTPSGTASSADYSESLTSATLLSGVEVTYLSVHGVNDTDEEPTETITLTLASGTDYTVGTPGSATINLYDNDTQYVSVARVADATEGGSDGTLRFTRTGNKTSSLTANYTVGGTATSGTDYTALTGTVTFAAYSDTADVTVPVTDDSTSEPTETVVATVAAGTGYTVGTADTVTVNILDDDAQVVTVAAASDGVEGGTNGTFRFTRIGDLSSSLTVNFTVGGTATSGTDFTAIGTTVTFAANEATADVDVAVLTDSLYDPSETVTVTVASGTGYSISTADTDTVVIVDSASLGFTLGSNVGTANYTILWSSVDETQATQSLSLSDFSLTLAGETFTPSTASFTTSPTAQFEYGVFVGITFAIDTSGVVGYDYDSVSMDGDANLTVTAIDRLTALPVMANALAKPEASVTNTAVGTANGSIDVKFAWADCAGATSAKVFVADKQGNVLNSKSLATNIADNKNAMLTVDTLFPNTDVDVYIVIFGANNKEIAKSGLKAGKTK